MEETNLKVRLVGATVLVSLAVIFIPMVLDGRESTNSEITETNIPTKPERGYISKVIPLTPVVTVKPVEKPKLVIKKGLAAQVAPKIEPANKSVGKTAKKVVEKSKKSLKVASAKSTPKPVTKKNTVQKLRAGLSAWAVQIGSFGSKKNAFALRDKLRKKGFKAFVDTVYVKDIANFRVRVGPEIKRESAETLRKKLASIYKGRTFIVKHPS